MTDNQIIDLFWNRNEDAIAATDAAYGRKLRGLSGRILQNPEDAEEIISDTLQQNGIYGGDVPEDTCYDWAEEYYWDADAEEDEVKEEPFVPKPYPGTPVKSKRQPKKEKPKTEPKTTKPAQVIQMPQPEKTSDEEQVSMFDMVGDLAG